MDTPLTLHRVRQHEESRLQKARKAKPSLCQAGVTPHALVPGLLCRRLSVPGATGGPGCSVHPPRSSCPVGSFAHICSQPRACLPRLNPMRRDRPAGPGTADSAMWGIRDPQGKAPTDSPHVPRFPQDSVYIFREGALPPYRQMFYQLCDLNVDEYVREGLRRRGGPWDGGSVLRNHRGPECPAHLPRAVSLGLSEGACPPGLA